MAALPSLSAAPSLRWSAAGLSPQELSRRFVGQTSVLRALVGRLGRSAESADHAEGLRAEQMEMFPPDARATVEQIGRGEVFVPSRNAFVPLLPSHLQPQEIDEEESLPWDQDGVGDDYELSI